MDYGYFDDGIPAAWRSASFRAFLIRPWQLTSSGLIACREQRNDVSPEVENFFVSNFGYCVVVVVFVYLLLSLTLT